MPPRKKMSQDDFFLELGERVKALSGKPNIKKYSPHAKQVEFHSSRRKKKLYSGGNRSGKTTGGVCEDIWRATKRHPYRNDLNTISEPIRGRVVAVDFPQGVEKILFPQFKQWLYPSAIKGGSWEVAYNKSLRELHFENGSIIEFMSYDQDLDKFAGTSRHFVHFDEEPPRPIYVECMARLIDTDGDFWITMTPVEGQTWIYEELFEPYVGLEDGEVHVIEVNTLENPYLSDAAIKNFVGTVDKDDVATRVAGTYVMQGGRVYKRFDPNPGGVHVLAEHIQHPEVVFKNWLWLQGLDHGLNNPTAIGWAAVNTTGHIILFSEHYHKEWSVKQHAEEIRRRESGWKRMADLRVADPSIQNRNSITMTSIHEEYANLGIAFTLGNNDVKSGIMRVKRYLDPAPLVGTVDPFFEELGFKVGDKIPRLMIDPICENFIKEAKKYRWKTYLHKKQQFENNPYDEPHKKDDHMMDMIRYVIMTRPDLRQDNESLAEAVQNAMAETGLDNFNPVRNSDQFGIADPHDRLYDNPDKNWDPELNSLPSNVSGDDWDYDEHMGGIY